MGDLRVTVDDFVPDAAAAGRLRVAPREFLA